MNKFNVLIIVVAGAIIAVAIFTVPLIGLSEMNRLAPAARCSPGPGEACYQSSQDNQEYGVDNPELISGLLQTAICTFAGLLATALVVVLFLGNRSNDSYKEDWY